MPSQREQAIRERAYAMWEQEDHAEGKDLDHWLRAEAEIMRSGQTLFAAAAFSGQGGLHADAFNNIEEALANFDHKSKRH